MEAYYSNQASNSMPHFSENYRRRGSGFGALAAGIGRLALPLARRVILPAEKKIGRELLVQGAPELLEFATMKKSAKQALKSTVKKTAKNKLEGHFNVVRKQSIAKGQPRRKHIKCLYQRKGSFLKKQTHKGVDRISSLKWKMRTNIVIPTEATHSSLDLFEKPPLLVTFDQSFEQKTGPLYSPTGSLLEFEIVGDRNNFIDLQKIYLEIKFRVVQNNGNDLRFTTGDANNSDTPHLVNNALHSLFTDCSVSANVIKISSANGHYEHKSFIETEFSHGSDAKKTWQKCQGYEYEADPTGVPAATITARQLTVRRSAQITMSGKIATNLFSCEKHLASGVTLRISFRRPQDDFTIVSEDGAKHFKIKIDEANLFVRKMTVSDNVVGAIEKTFLQTPAMYRYNEVISKAFLATAGQQSWKQEDIFTKEPIRRLIVAMCRSDAFIGTNTLYPISYRKFDLNEIKIYRNGFATAGTLMSTTDNKRLYYNSMAALAYVENGHGISLTDFPENYIMVFDLTSTQEATHDFIHPELTNSSLSVELKFGAALPNNIEILFLGE